MGLYGVIWDYMALYGVIWNYMGSYGVIWGCMGSHGAMRGSMGLYGGLWGCTGFCGAVWGYGGVPGGFLTHDSELRFGLRGVERGGGAALNGPLVPIVHVGHRQRLRRHRIPAGRP